MFSGAYSMCRKREIVACEQDIGLDIGLYIGLDIDLDTGSDTGFYLGLYTGSDIFRNIISYQEKINKHTNGYRHSAQKNKKSLTLTIVTFQYMIYNTYFDERG